jgi:hypothetical protein
MISLVLANSHLSTAELRCKLQEKSHRLTGPLDDKTEFVVFLLYSMLCICIIKMYCIYIRTAKEAVGHRQVLVY